MSELVREMFSHVDGFTVSFKKDGLANMGGGLFVREGGLFHQLHGDVLRALVDDQVRTEGHPSYGGLSGRDLMALVVGLRRVTDPAYLSHRIGQVRTLGEELRRRDLPIVTPVGGHAVYLEVDEFFRGTQMRPGDFGGVALSALLLAGFGHRTGEVGAFNFGIYDPDTGEERLPPFNYLRFAVPRLRYEAEDLRAVAEAMRVLHEARSRIPAVDVVHGRELPLRYFKARLRFREGSGT
jgi:tryptophanase